MRYLKVLKLNCNIIVIGYYVAPLTAQDDSALTLIEGIF